MGCEGGGWGVEGWMGWGGDGWGGEGWMGCGGMDRMWRDG